MQTVQAISPEMPLNSWVGMFERIYYQSQNYERSIHQLLLRLYETTLNLQKGALKTSSFESVRDVWLPKLFAWYCAVMKALNVSDLETLVWKKFPAVCPFCLQEACACVAGRDKRLLDRNRLARLVSENSHRKPGSLSEWQGLFDSIYQQSSRGTIPPREAGELRFQAGNELLQQGLFKLYEELTELAESIRLNAFYPLNLQNEVADVFACICAIANLLPPGFDRQVKLDLGAIIWSRYPSTCDTCKQRICICRLRAVAERLSAEGIDEYPRRDLLTKLFNREKYEIDRDSFFQQPPTVTVAEILFDCDHFKKYNDETAGKHAQGDAVLKYVADSTVAAVGEIGTVYRIGGDEFVVLMVSDDPGKAMAVAELVRCRIGEGEVADITDGRTYKVSVSVGVALRSATVGTPNDLHQRADELMYEAKRAGGDRIMTDKSNAR
jgi:diguanylate cyclase (GGDEF)-like protein